MWTYIEVNINQRLLRFKAIRMFMWILGQAGDDEVRLADDEGRLGDDVRVNEAHKVCQVLL